MGKRWHKQKAGHQQSRRRKRAQPVGESAGSSGGTMGSMRGGLRGFFGGGKKSKSGSTVGRVLDIALWLAVAVAAYVFVLRQCA